MEMIQQELWERCVAFHGHACPGLAIGCRAALYAAELLGLTFSEDEETVCVAENDACGVDAIQVVLGCSVGKGNLLFHMTGKQAFSVYDRTTGRSVRLVLKGTAGERSREESLRFYRTQPAEALFDVKETRIALPERARLFDAYVCEDCGETVGGGWVRIQNGRKLCLDCAGRYDRFRV